MRGPSPLPFVRKDQGAGFGFVFAFKLEGCTFFSVPPLQETIQKRVAGGQAKDGTGADTIR